MIRTIGIGDNVCDKYRHLDQMFPGGQALNFAVYCRREGKKSAYLGAFGNDKIAEHVKNTLDRFEIDRSRCRTYPEENGYAVVDLKDGERVFVTSNKGGALKNHPLDLSAEDLDYLRSFDVIHTSNNSYIVRELPKLARLPGLLSYDFSGSWKDGELTKQICPYLDFAFFSCSSLTEAETEEQEKKMSGWGCKTVVATRGEQGSVLFDGQRFYPDRPELVDALDTLGAGDSFAAGVLMAYAEALQKGIPEKGSEAYREMIRDAMQNGDRLSRKTCMTYGAFGCGTKLVP